MGVWRQDTVVADEVFVWRVNEERVRWRRPTEANPVSQLTNQQIKPGPICLPLVDKRLHEILTRSGDQGITLEDLRRIAIAFEVDKNGMSERSIDNGLKVLAMKYGPCLSHEELSPLREALEWFWVLSASSFRPVTWPLPSRI